MAAIPLLSSHAPWSPAPTTVAPPAARPPRSPAGPGRLPGGLQRQLNVPVWLAALAGLTLVAAAVACIVLAVREDSSPAPAAATAASGTLVRALRDPFELQGVRWAVFATPSQPWTAFADRVSPGAGRRWVLVAVRVRNLSRARFAPADLGYALLDDSGRRIAPDPHRGTPPGSGAVSVDGHGQVELAFRVPEQATNLHLRYVTAPRGGIAVDVPLGAT
jgi:hypothetical protein